MEALRKADGVDVLLCFSSSAGQRRETTAAFICLNPDRLSRRIRNRLFCPTSYLFWLSSTQSNTFTSSAGPSLLIPLSLSLSLLNSQLLYSDESVFHYLLRRLRPPRRFLQHIEELVHKPPVCRAKRTDYTVSGEACRQRKTRRRQTAIYAFFCEVPVGGVFLLETGEVTLRQP